MWNIYIRTWFRGQYIGQDRWMNRYYRDKRANDWKTEARWVLYKGIPEASKIPPIWDAWLRHERQYAPLQKEQGYAWEKQRLPNLTGTRFALSLMGTPHAYKNANSMPAYQPWIPPEPSEQTSSEEAR